MHKAYGVHHWRICVLDQTLVLFFYTGDSVILRHIL